MPEDNVLALRANNRLLKLDICNCNKTLTSVVYSEYGLKLEDHNKVPRINMFLLSRGLDQRAGEVSCSTPVISNWWVYVNA